MKKVLFILKKRHVYGGGYGGGYHEFPSGLINSARFVSDMLNHSGYESKVVDVQDNNDIDREVFNFKPDIVIIEALWVVPEKFEVLKKLHPNVKWIVRIHSEVPFLAQEGIAVEWLKAYGEIPDVYVGTNSLRALHDLRLIIDEDKLLFLPNFYPRRLPRCGFKKNHRTLDIGCFGAIRPFKNQLIQAFAAMLYADSVGKKLRFHVNSTRLEQQGGNVLKNLRALLSDSGHKLVEHRWEHHRHFLKTLATMDLSMSVSFSETFCIVAADAVSVGVPIVVSEEVPWAHEDSMADTTNTKDIVEHMQRALGWKSVILNFLNRINLRKYSKRSRHEWLEELRELLHA